MDYRGAAVESAASVVAAWRGGSDRRDVRKKKKIKIRGIINNKILFS